MKICDRRVDDVVEHIRTRYDADLPNYSDCVHDAFVDVDAVFWREQYLAFYWKCVSTVPGYIQNVVLANAKAESHGSEGLFDLWRKVRGAPQIEDGVRSHFLDEARHARLFVHLTDLTFPSFLDRTSRSHLKANLFDAPNAILAKDSCEASIEYILDNMIQMNIGEIRTRAHMFMIGPVLTGLAPANNKESVDGILTGLVYDEVTHIGYTAVIMEEMCRNGYKEFIGHTYKRRLLDFNRFTIDQTRESLARYGQGEFPELLEI